MILLILFQVSSSLQLTFGSCSGMFGMVNPAIWRTIAELKPTAFIWLGDVIYADSWRFPFSFVVPSEEEWRAKYNSLKQSDAYRELRESTRILGVWDDHDYGKNDENRYFSEKILSKHLFLEFLDEPSDSTRYQREGIYDSYMFYEGEVSVKVILLDDRTFLDPAGADADTLGEIQWRWLEAEFTQDVDFFIIMNGIQVNVEDRLIRVHEKWHEKSRVRLLNLLKRFKNSLLVTGDVHFSEILSIDCNKHQVIEFTNSGLTHTVKTTYGWLSAAFIEFLYPYTYSILPRIYDISFGSIKITKSKQVQLSIINSFGSTLQTLEFSINDLNTPILPSGSCSQSSLELQLKHCASLYFVILLPIQIWLFLAIIYLQKLSNSY